MFLIHIIIKLKREMPTFVAAYGLDEFFVGELETVNLEVVSMEPAGDF